MADVKLMGTAETRVKTCVRNLASAMESATTLTRLSVAVVRNGAATGVARSRVRTGNIGLLIIGVGGVGWRGSRLGAFAWAVLLGRAVFGWVVLGRAVLGRLAAFCPVAAGRAVFGRIVLGLAVVAGR